MTVSLTLYYAPGACSIASHIALQEAQIPFDLRSVALGAGEQRSPDFLALNPKGRIPLVITPFGPLTENPAILEYVAALAPEGQLAPVNDASKLAKMREFNCFLSATVHGAHAHGPRGGRWAKTESALQDMKAQVADNMLSAFELIEQTLQSGPWVLGKRLLDCRCLPLYLCPLAGDGPGGYPWTEGRACASSSNGAATCGTSRFGRGGDSL